MSQNIKNQPYDEEYVLISDEESDHTSLKKVQSTSKPRSKSPKKEFIED